MYCLPGSLGTLEGALELDMSGNAIGFDNNIVTGVIDERTKNLGVNTTTPQCSKQFTDEQVFKNGFTIGRLRVVSRLAH